MMMKRQIPWAQNSSRKVLPRAADKGSHWPKLHQDKGGSSDNREGLRQLTGGGGVAQMSVLSQQLLNVV